MRTKPTYLLFILLLLTVVRAVGQDLYEIDKVCVGAERNYRIDGLAGSVYVWLLTDPTNTVTTLPESGDTVNILWTLPTGIYHLTNIQLGSNGCDTTQLGYIEVFDQPNAYAGNDIILCSPDPFLLASATASAYSALLWTTSGDGTFDDATQPNPTYSFGTNDILAGTVTLTLSATGFGNAGSCPPAESGITIILNHLTATASPTAATCNGTPEGSVTILASGGSEPYTYNLDGDINSTGIFNGLAAATYTYIITDHAGCETTGEVTIDQPALLMASLTHINVNCFGQTNGSISITNPAGGSGNYEYRINGGDWQPELDFTALPPGDYLVEIRDTEAPDCIVVLGTITITEPELLTANVTHTPTSYPGANDGNITVTDAMGGSGAYQYSIDGINWQDSPIFPNLAPGTYTVYIRDANATDCFLDVEELEILEGLALTAQVEYIHVSCFGFDDGSITLTNPANGGGNYEYSIDGGLTWQPAATFPGLQPATYVVMMRDADQPANNIELAIIEITEPEQLLVSVDPASGEICIHQSLALNATSTGGTGTSIHAWTGTGAVYLDALDIENPVFTGNVAGNFSLYYTATDENGCSTTSAEVGIVVNDEITPTFAPIGPLCQNSTAPALPLTSLEGITGTWNPAAISTAVAGSFTFVFTPDNPAQCGIPGGMEIVITDEITPTFAPIGPLCQNSIAPELPLTSLEGISGTWNPAAISTAVAGSFTFVFTPDNPAQCGIPGGMEIVITDEITPTFASIGPLCQNSTAPALPLTSLEGITGTWNPATINTTVVGTTTYTFTPEPGGCAIVTTMDISIEDEIIPTFAPIGPLCQNSTAPELPLISLEGISGTWNPAAISTAVAGSFTFVFTPDNPAQCGIPGGMEIVITDEITPTFAPIGPLCQNSIAPELPLTSLEGITGTWSPAVISTAVAGSFTFVFTPDNPAQCGIPGGMEIVINDEITPTFAPIGPLCQNSTAPELPLTSLEGITGTWNPAVISTAVAGSFTFVFTPDDPAQCGIPGGVEIVIIDEITPTFAPIGPLCQNSIAPELPLTSLEGITGTWNPAAISTTVAGSFTFVFTPDNPAQCGIPGGMEIVINDEITPTFAPIGPLCQNSTAPELPLTSLEGITGTWNPAAISTAVPGSFTFVFTPDNPAQCGIPGGVEIVINDEITPTFAPIGPLCQNSTAPALPLTSLEGITGTWSPAVISTAVAGSFTFVFTPDNPAQCGIPGGMEIVITDEITPTFAPIGPLCQNSTAPELPLTSLEGITGTWNPAAISTAVAGSFTFVFTPDNPAQCGISGGVEIVITDEITPTFAPIGPLCQNSTAPELPLTSLEGLTGTWNPAVISTAVVGSFTFVFTPDDPAQCGIPGGMEIVITDEITPTFAPIGPLCQNSTAPELPLTSLEGITGTWNPATINTTVVGTTTYTFTPEPGGCAIVTTMNISIEDQILPTFAPIGPLCQNSTAPVLPLTSLEGITGTWNPATINTTIIGTTTYTFTPEPGGCAIETTMDITIEDEILPTFNQIGPLCQNSTAPELPLTSLEGITGTWNPATINTTVVGTTTYTFTPEPGGCAIVTTMDISIEDEILPTFAPIGPLCQNSTAPALPLTSLEGITGTWNPAVISTAVVGSFTFVFTPDNPAQCGIPGGMEIVITDEITPTFAPIGPLCQNSTAPELPLTSLEGITGTWNPATINTTVVGTTTYTFTPEPGGCAIEITMNISIEDEIIPTFAPIGPLCQNSTAPELPLTSLEGITGTWNPATINTTVVGTTTYTFTPDPAGCAIVTTMDITIEDEILPTFAPIGPLCQNSTAPELPLTSLEGITGTWNPATINTTVVGTTTYTFTPEPGGCAIVTTMNISIEDQILPTFAPIGPLCQNSTAPVLPLTSLEGITGTWNPATINTTIIGTTTYTFTPEPGGCAIVTTMDISIEDEIIPTFAPIGPLCQNSTAPELPLTSLEGITGTCNPATINTTVVGTTTYTFTPEPGGCAIVTTMDISIEDEILPTFAPIGPLCQNSTAPELPLTSLEGITGTWNPATINTTTVGTFTYTFTPEPGGCAIEAIMNISIENEILPTFAPIGPLCQNSIAPELPLTSLEGISGTWNPAAISTAVAGSFTFVFTPDNPAQCGIPGGMEIVITDEITPTFAPIGPLCQNSIAPELPLTSLEGITGTWSPAVISTAVAGSFTFVFTPDNPAQCGIPGGMEIVINDEITPTFAPIGPLCQNSTAPELPLTSLEGITGTWNPAAISTAVAGSFTFVFTPDNPAQCGIPGGMEIVITDEITPTFAPIGPLCQNSTAPALPLTSLEGISGTWNPAAISTAVAGSFTFVFTPDNPAQCGIPGGMEIVITDEITPTFAPIGPLCLNSIAPALPLTSLEGITGTWNPATIITSVVGTTTYTFTPEPGGCAIETTMNISIEDEILPTFAPIGPLCQNSTAPALPLTSLEGITGTWNPATINTTISGTFTYTFTPEPGGCAIEITMNISIEDEIIPTFAPIGPLCQNSTAPELPLTSLEGITGTWNPATINTTTVGTFTYTFTPEPGGCAIETTMNISIEDEIIPTFAPIGPLCQNSIAPELPLTSLEGITGTWNPATINTSVVGTTTYTFTPEPGGCAIETTMNISIEDEILPTFAPIGPLCQNSTAPALPLTSLEGITGTWNPATINTTIVGTTTYTFTPDPGGCAIVTTMDISIEDEIIPTFAPIGPLCQNSTAPALPLTSLEGITGSWNPATINTSVVGTTTYTFTPEPGGCAIVTTMDISIEDEIISTFAPIGPLCQNSTAPELPLTSLEGITGTWNPATINTTIVGTTTYTFTPDPGGCAIVTTMDISIEDEILPTFAPIGPLCQNSTAPALPLTSLEGITGTWNPATINTTVVGTTTYTFTPEPGGCAIETTLNISIEDEILPTFAPIGPLCQNSTAPELPLTSLEGITGTWNPATINTTVVGTTTYTFTPEPGGCAIVTTMDISIEDEIIPTFAPIGPLCQNSTAPELPLTSLEGITGTWNPATINTTISGTFTYTFTPEPGGCLIEYIALIEIWPQPEIISVNTTDASLAGDDGALEIIANGWALPLQYSLDGLNWQFDNRFSGLPIGNGTAWVMDNNGCMATMPYIIMQVIDGKVEISVDTLNYCLNVPVIIPVEARDFTQVGEFLIELEFDASLLTFIELIAENPVLSTGIGNVSLAGNILQIRYSWFDGWVSLPSGEDLFSIHFAGNAPGISNLTWNLLQCKVYSPAGDTIPSIFTNGLAEIYPAPLIYAQQYGEFCSGDTLSLVSGSLDDQELEYLWTGPAGNKHHEAIWPLGKLSVGDGGLYRIVATNDYQCGEMREVPVIVNPSPQFRLSYADTVCWGQPLMLDPGEFVSYLWQDGSTHSSMVAYEPGVYWVNVTDDKGCRAVDSVALIPCIIELLVPNAFTPNGDGLNDEFMPIFRGFEPSRYHMQIYSKWGQLVFETNEINVGWDGTIDNVPCSPDAFTYIISFEAPSYVTRKSLSSPVTGAVTLIR